MDASANKGSSQPGSMTLPLKGSRHFELLDQVIPLLAQELYPHFDSKKPELDLDSRFCSVMNGLLW
jgi:hypothetical protein